VEKRGRFGEYPIHPSFITIKGKKIGLVGEGGRGQKRDIKGKSHWERPEG